MSEERFDQIDRDLAELKIAQGQLSRDVAHVHDALSREMRILYEQTVDNIRALSVHTPELERRWRADDAELREDIGGRLDPLEAVVRKHFDT